ncbi:peptidyl-prolyl cis-trans isomerase B [Bacteriovorax sp. BAL6_X]|uniref:peptidylprolyl isomerase n=1 Tax=Bacteriovorax sp. BAL6_X TaxID=1201290 RepID=UPI000386BD8F|nr:peptidylprolyl isomerase [Bacteriovorax sp. BAL6_X]EPZ52325.1 peptidyl-prolyl cis-trans isomerase B [Bacteriovorax sp. BAL6_X]
MKLKLKLKLLFILLIGLSVHANTKVMMKTNYGDITIKLYDKKAPETVKNFLSYVNSGFYNGTIFHRVIDGFMIQGGGYDTSLKKKKTEKPIKNEATNGLSNVLGTIAMARTSVINSATSQFFVNVKDNTFLDHLGPTPSQYGYAVFGKVISGMAVVNRIKKSKTGRNGPFQNLPVSNIEIKKVYVLP